MGIHERSLAYIKVNQLVLKEELDSATELCQNFILTLDSLRHVELHFRILPCLSFERYAESRCLAHILDNLSIAAK